METENKPITLSVLEGHLWESANILRGPVDAADFKSYIFPMLFFKRISDVFDEEVGSVLKESEGNQDYALKSVAAATVLTSELLTLLNPEDSF
jgi:type I restriction enzyme M protein